MPQYELYGCSIDVTDDTKSATCTYPDGTVHRFHSGQLVTAQVQAQRCAKAYVPPAQVDPVPPSEDQE
jgi:hypothetical protein